MGWTFGVVELARWYRQHRLEVRAGRRLVREAEAYLRANHLPIP